MIISKAFDALQGPVLLHHHHPLPPRHLQQTKLNWVESRMKQTEVNWRKAMFSMISRDRCSSTGRLKQLCWKSCRGRPGGIVTQPPAQPVLSVLPSLYHKHIHTRIQLRILYFKNCLASFIWGRP